ncbi:MAG: hypothetical protein AB7O68_16915 [Pirellulales bacterium]
MSGKKDTNIGTKNGEKFKTPEQRQTLFDAYCEHVRKGYSDQSFPECDVRTLEYYVIRYASALQADLIERARRERQLFWEKLGTAGTGGKVRGFNALSWKFNMQNRFDWREKKDERVTVERDGAADLAEALLESNGEPQDGS